MALGLNFLRVRGLLHWAGVLVAAGVLSPRASAAEPPDFVRAVEPIPIEYCCDCHGDGSDKGNVAFDELEGPIAGHRELWTQVLKNVRAGVMPPNKKPRPGAEEQPKTSVSFRLANVGFIGTPTRVH
ncbi:MAG TPA: hypothetical protein DCY13_03280 [Verrucomicrobiales bacterium]|nr:hypothetical protein [Verrucomicrobiales bacterium]